MGYPPELLNDQTKHHWSVKLFDKPNGLADRDLHMEQHKNRLADFKAKYPGAVEFGGPMLDTVTHQPIGSVFVLARGKVFPTQKEVEEWIEEDAYKQNKVWARSDISLFLGLTNPYSFKN